MKLPIFRSVAGVLIGFSTFVAILVVSVAFGVWHLLHRDHSDEMSRQEITSVKQVNESRNNISASRNENVRNRTAIQQEGQQHVQSEPVPTHYGGTINEVSDYRNKNIATINTDVKADFTLAVILLIMLGVLSVVAGLLIALMGARWINTRSQGIAVYAASIAPDLNKGELTRQIDTTQATPESLLQASGIIRGGLVTMVSGIRNGTKVRATASVDIVAADIELRSQTGQAVREAAASASPDRQPVFAARDRSDELNVDRLKNKRVPNLHSRQSL